MTRDPFQAAATTLDGLIPARVTGTVEEISGLAVVCRGLPAPVGARCRIALRSGGSLDAEVVGFRGRDAVIMPYGDLHGAAPGDAVRLLQDRPTAPVGRALLGRVLDAQGNPIDGLGPLAAEDRAPLHNTSPAPLERTPIREPMPTGVRALDGLTTLGRGQRMGLFSGSGVGKSTLMGMIARNTSASINVIGLVGERGREVREFVENALGEEGLQRSVVVVSTSDEPALLRVRAPFLATAVAEWFRDQGEDVLLMVDSITRMSMAQREIGLSAGEPPATRGYPPSVFAMMPRLLERAGTSALGSITGIYCVLVEADDMGDPIGDTARSILDGHVWLSRDLAGRGWYPAVDVLDSVSRLMTEVTDPDHRHAASVVRRLLATWRDAEDLIHVGAYARGSDPDIDRAIEHHDAIRDFLTQEVEDRATWDETVERLRTLAAAAEAGGAEA